MNHFVRKMIARGYWDEVSAGESVGGGSDGGWTPPADFTKSETELVNKGLDEMSGDYFGFPSEEGEKPGDPPADEAPPEETPLEKPEDKPAEEAPADSRSDEEKAKDEQRAFQGDGDVNKLPKAWKAGLAAEYAALPEAIKQEIHRREDNMYKGFEQMRPAVDFALSIDEAIRPFANILQEQQATPQQAVGYLFSMYSVLTKGTPEQKVAAFNHLLTESQVSASQLTGFDPDAQAFVDPAVQELRKELTGVKSELSKERTERENALRQQAAAAFDNFVKANPLAEKCMDDMLPYLRAGLPLDQAFEKAKFANPVVRAELLKQEADAKKAEEAKRTAEKAERAKLASKTAVRDNSRRGGPTAPLGNIDDTMKEVFANINARS